MHSGSLMHLDTTKTIIAAPALALIGTLCSCLPVVGSIVAGICGFMAVLVGYHAVRDGLASRRIGMGTPEAPEGEVTKTQKVLLLVSGLVGGLWGLGLVGTFGVHWIIYFL